MLILLFGCKQKKHQSKDFEKVKDSVLIEKNDSINSWVISSPPQIDLLEGLSEKEINSFFEEKKEVTNIYSNYFIANKLDSMFLISNEIKPNSFVADFNGDGEEDIVIFVEHVRNNKRGLIFFHSPIDYFVVGAGNENSVFENINYTEFSIDRSKIAYETVIDSITGDIIEPNVIKLDNIALHMHEKEGTSGMLTWNGESYFYIHTGD